MSTQNSLDKYFFKRKETDKHDSSTKKQCVQNENVICQSNITSNESDYSTTNNGSICSIQLVDKNMSSSSTLTDEPTEKRTYKAWYSEKFPWLIYEPNVGGFCKVCRNYWKQGLPLFRDMKQKTKGVFTSSPFTSWKNAPGENGRLMRHSRSQFHLIAVDNAKFRQQEGCILNRLITVSEEQKQENRYRLYDLLDCCYFLFKNELPHTTLYNLLLQLASRLDHSSKLSDFFQNCQKNATYDSTTYITEFLEATNEILEKNILQKIQRARVISIMSDEGTDVNRHGNLCICIRYCDQVTGEPAETYVKLKKKNIGLNKVRFVAFDGAAVFGGIHNGVAAKFCAEFNLAILFIHCYAHALQLAVLSSSVNIPEISKSLSTLKTLISFINRSSVRLNLFEKIQDVLKNFHIKLIQPGDTRWLSNSLAIRSVLRPYQSILMTLEQISNGNDDDSAETLGLYTILSSESTTFILHVLQSVLDTLAVLSKCIQTKAADFDQLEDFVSSTMLRLEQLKDFDSSDYTDIIQTIRTLSLTRPTFRTLRSSTSNDELTFEKIFQRVILPFLDNIINNVKARFERETLDLLKCFKIFDMKNINDDKDYGEKELHNIKEHYSVDFNESIVYE